MKIATIVGGRQPQCVRRLAIASSTPTITRTRSARVGTTAISPRQAQTLDVIRRFRKARDVSPTHSEMRALLGTGTKSQISPLLQALSQRSWLKVLPGVERGCIPLREGVPLYDAERLRPVETNMALREEEPPEPIWVDCPALWESCFGKIPDLCLRMQCDAVEGRDILALGRRRDAAGNVTIADGDQVAVRIEEDIVLATARVLDENTVELRWGSAEGKTPTIRMTEESDAAEIVGTVIGRLLPGPG